MTLPIDPMLGLLLFAEEAAEDEGTFNPILPAVPEMIWSGLAFFGLWALMKFVLLPPIMAGRDERRAKVAAGLDSVSDSESELAQIRAAHNDHLNVAKAEAASIVDAARAEADEERAQAMAAVEEQIGKLRSNAQREIDSARVTAMAGARGPVSELAAGAAGKVLGTNVDVASNQSVIDSFLNRVKG